VGLRLGAWAVRDARCARSTLSLQPPNSQPNLQPPPPPYAPAAQEPGAVLIDIGDGVLQIEFHSKMNAIGGDTIEMIHAGRAARRRRTSPRSSSPTARRTSRPAPT
jgi:hypothetical protein